MEITDKYLVAEQDGKFIPMKQEKFEGRTYFTAIQESMGENQTFALSQTQKPNFSMGYSNRDKAEEVARGKWGQGIQFESKKMANQQIQVNIYENYSLNKFVPQVEITKNGTTKRGHLYNRNGNPEIHLDKSPLGMGRVDFHKGWESLEKAQAEAKGALGKNIKISVATGQEKTFIYQKDGKFIPVSTEIQKNGTQIIAVLGQMAGRITERGNTSSIGDVIIRNRDGFPTIKEAVNAAHQKWGIENIKQIKLKQNNKALDRSRKSAVQGLSKRKTQSRAMAQTR